ncbi:MAG: hypothetical protein COA94_05190 [Rickettsiales bacterium]|nr:MAG: hypothetical protein COA94_05190 [Rickettsiales bacterium]
MRVSPTQTTVNAIHNKHVGHQINLDCKLMGMYLEGLSLIKVEQQRKEKQEKWAEFIKVLKQ